MSNDNQPDQFAQDRSMVAQPDDRSAFTYKRQPDNIGAWRIGEACRKAADASAGDYIDRGLLLLKELQAKGYGIVALDAHPAEQRMSDAARDAEDAVRYRWLRERHWNESTLFVVAGHHSLVRLGTDCPSDERLDAAIDAEIERIDRAEGNRSPIDGNRSMISVPASHVICEVAGVTIIGSPDNVAAARAALEAAPLPAYPEEITPELREVLAWPNFKCAPVAHAFQAAGYPIAKRAEDEQAFVLHWFTKLVLRHGGQWWEKACEEIASLAENARTRRAEAPNAD